jgi:monoamine oxidase
MARTPALLRVQRLFGRVLATAAGGASVRTDSSLSRRSFLEQMLLGLSAGLGTTSALGGCRLRGETGRRHSFRAPRIAVVGAGLAGLSCAHRLKQAGIEATVYEASSRVGGRVFSTRPGRFPDAQIGELGGEFIDTGHLTLHALARELDIQLDDRNLEFTASGATDVWWLSGRAVPEALIAQQFVEVAPLLGRLAASARDDEVAFARLDATSLAGWLRDNLAAQPELSAAIAAAYRGEFGLDAAQQSSLNLLFSIGSDTPDVFRLFGDSDERYHTHSGNQTFATRLAEQLSGQIELDRKLLAAEGDAGTGYRLCFERSDRSRVEVSAELLVFALPFSILRELDCNRLPIGAHKRAVIRQLGYGSNAKLLGGFARRVWSEDHHATGAVVSDAAFQQLWDSSPGQAGRAGILTNFLGGEQGVNSGVLDAEAWYRDVTLSGGEEVFPRLREAYVAGSALRMHWPSYPFSRGSYSCYRPGQWAFWGTEGLPEAAGTLHFCGEHTSVDHQGFMEGAAESGTLVAGAILERLGIEPAPPHAALLRVKRAVAQPAYGERTFVRGRLARARHMEDVLLSLAGLSPRRARSPL